MSRKSSSGGARTRACRVHTRVNAGQVFARVRVQPVAPFGVSARPGIILHLSYHPSLERIPFNISSNPVPFIFVPHPVIIRFAPPERFAGSPEQLISFPRSESFERLQQLTGRYLRKQQYVDMVCHDCKRSKPVVTKFRALEKRINNPLRDRVLLEEHRSGASGIQVPVHPNKRFAGGDLAGRREPRVWKTAMQVPGDEQPATLGIIMGKPAL